MVEQRPKTRARRARPRGSGCGATCSRSCSIRRLPTSHSSRESLLKVSDGGAEAEDTGAEGEAKRKRLRSNVLKELLNTETTYFTQLKKVVAKGKRWWSRGRRHGRGGRGQEEAAAEQRAQGAAQYGDYLLHTAQESRC